MRYVFLLLFPFLLNAQTNDLSTLNSIEENEQVIIDVMIGGCFDGAANTKLIITKKGNEYEFIYIENIYKVVATIDKKILLHINKLEKWIAENIETLAKHGERKIITKEQFSSKIEIVQNTIKAFNDCTSQFVGEYSIIKIKSNRLQFEKKFSCKIKLDL